MRKIIFLTSMVCLLAFSAFAQSKTTDFSGTWELDKSKSKLDERMRDRINDDDGYANGKRIKGCNANEKNAAARRRHARRRSR